MPIIINEFELVVDPPPSPKPGSPGPEAPAAPAEALRPDEIGAVMQVMEERRQRVRAD